MAMMANKKHSYNALYTLRPSKTLNPHTAISRTGTFFLSNHVFSLSLPLLLHPLSPNIVNIVFHFFIFFYYPLTLYPLPLTSLYPPFLVYISHVNGRGKSRLLGPKNALLCAGQRTRQSIKAVTLQRGGQSPSCFLMAACILCARAIINSILYK